MPRIPRLTADQRANLVAYLDGELDEADVRGIEVTLAGSDVARHEVEMLSRTWELLDALPRETASAEFTQRTLATVHVQTEQRQPPRWRGAVDPVLTSLGYAGVLAAAGLVGYAAGSRWIPRESDRLVRDLPLLERLNAYQDAGSVEFLRELELRGVPRPGASP